jgi:hypothetical protein
MFSAVDKVLQLGNSLLFKLNQPQSRGEAEFAQRDHNQINGCRIGKFLITSSTCG